MLKKLKNLYPHQTLISIFMAGLVIMCSSIIIQYVFKVEPCEMCYWQRYLAIGITAVAFLGTLFRGRIKKKFLAVIALLAFASAFIGAWQSLAQAGLIELDAVCQGPIAVKQEQAAKLVATTPAEDSAKLLENLKNNNVNYVDCSVPEDFFLFNKFGISLANVNTILMLLIGSLAFYKLFFVPRKRFRKYNNRYRNNRNNGNRRYRGSGYRRANNRNNRHPHNNNRYHNNRNHHNRNNNDD